MKLCSISGQSELAKLLVDHGADVNIKDDENSTALHLASAHGDTAFRENKFEMKVIQVVFFLGVLKIARLLFAKGADIESRSNSGSTPLEVAIWNCI